MTCAQLLSPARAPPHPLTPASLTSQFRLEQRGESGSGGRPAWRTTPAGELQRDQAGVDFAVGRPAVELPACPVGDVAAASRPSWRQTRDGSSPLPVTAEISGRVHARPYAARRSCSR